ncbi:MAG: LCP family protein [Solirubrobacterales bacterium]|nr:LCP family protein [Solirubrobacterales bacterium]
MQPFDDSNRPGIWKKLFLGAFLVIFAAASATAVAAFREIDKVVDALDQHEDLALGKELAETDPGEAQTILLLGSDRRPDDAVDGGAGTGARSDTIILVRLNPEENATALMSLPRDLRVEIPGHGVDKINAAYTLGGPRLTLRTVKELTGLSINHVINVDFQGFQKAIDSLGCIYTDVDRRYYNDSAEYAFIDVPSGYQRMCGEKALQYARFRHEDSDLVRGIRQQDLLRDAKQQVGARELFDDRDELIEIFGRYTTSDRQLKDRAELLRLIKLGLFSVGQPIRHVKFEGDDVGITAGDEATNTPSYVTASDATVKKLAQQFLGTEDTPGPRGSLRRKGAGKRKVEVKADADPGGLAKDDVYGLEQAVSAIERGLGGRKFPVYYPTVRVGDSQYVGTRVYPIRTPEGKLRRSYRMVLQRPYVSEFYGIQGTRWKDPPILANPTETRKVGKREFELHWEGDRLRLVAWRTPRASYWVSNTLLQTLSEKQMMAIARSTRLP